jgi:hypothetical protein
MPSDAAKDIKFGFWVAAGFAVFGIVLTIIVGMSMWALGRQ